MGQGKQSCCEYILGPKIIETCHLVIDYPLENMFFPLKEAALIEIMLLNKDLYLGDLFPRGKAFS